MNPMQTLKQVANGMANGQPKMVDALTEEAPILKVCRWKKSSHGLWHNAQVVKDIDGPSFVEMNSPLPNISMVTNLTKIDLQIMGGEDEVTEDLGNQYGGHFKYFEDRRSKFLRKAGNDTEAHLYMKNWLKYAVDNKNVINAGGNTANSVSSIVCVHFDEESNTGLYDGRQFDNKQLLKVDSINDGQRYHLRTPKWAGVLGYGVTLKGYFGWMLLDKRYVSAIVNIDKNNLPTADQIDDMVAMARGKSGTSYVFCHARTKVLAINPHKTARLMTTVKDNAMGTEVETWNGIPIIGSYNLPYLTESVVK